MRLVVVTLVLMASVAVVHGFVARFAGPNAKRHLARSVKKIMHKRGNVSMKRRDLEVEHLRRMVLKDRGLHDKKSTKKTKKQVDGSSGQPGKPECPLQQCTGDYETFMYDGDWDEDTFEFTPFFKPGEDCVEVHKELEKCVKTSMDEQSYCGACDPWQVEYALQIKENINITDLLCVERPEFDADMGFDVDADMEFNADMPTIESMEAAFPDLEPAVIDVLIDVNTIFTTDLRFSCEAKDMIGGIKDKIADLEIPDNLPPEFSFLWDFKLNPGLYIATIKAEIDGCSLYTLEFSCIEFDPTIHMLCGEGLECKVRDYLKCIREQIEVAPGCQALRTIDLRTWYMEQIKLTLQPLCEAQIQFETSMNLCVQQCSGGKPGKPKEPEELSIIDVWFTYLRSLPNPKVWPDCDEWGLTYAEDLTKTKNGKTCLNWMDTITTKLGQLGIDVPSDTPELFWLDEEADPGNNCRNPDGDLDGVWCFTKLTDGDEHLEWEYCDVTFCDGDDNSIFTQVNPVGEPGQETYYTDLGMGGEFSKKVMKKRLAEQKSLKKKSVQKTTKSDLISLLKKVLSKTK